jgi:hypothetical protein
MSSEVAAKVFKGFPAPLPLVVRPGAAPSSKVSSGCPYIYVHTSKVIHHLTFLGTPFSNMVSEGGVFHHSNIRLPFSNPSDIEGAIGPFYQVPAFPLLRAR